MIEMSVANAKGKLSELINRALNGERVILTKHGRPVAQITPVEGFKTVEQKRRALKQILEKAAEVRTKGFDGENAGKNLFGRDGMPS